MDDEIDKQTGFVVHRYPACLVPSPECAGRRIQLTKVDGKIVGRHIAICELCTQEHTVNKDERLWGTPGAEYMQSDAASVYEVNVDGQIDADEMARGVIIEEWTVEDDNDVLQRVRSADMIIEDIHDMFCGDYGGDGVDPLDGIEKDPEALAATETLRGIIAKKATGWRWAKTKIADHTITWDAAGEPLLDGEPLYVKREAPE